MVGAMGDAAAGLASSVAIIRRHRLSRLVCRCSLPFLRRFLFAGSRSRSQALRPADQPARRAINHSVQP